MPPQARPGTPAPCATSRLCGRPEKVNFVNLPPKMPCKQDDQHLLRMKKRYEHLITIEGIRSIDQAIAELIKINSVLPGSELENFLPFNSVYIVVTEELRSAINQQIFNQPEIMEQLDLNFIAIYFQALNEFVTNRRLTPAWEPIREPHLPSFIYALLGANIHISYDLSLAIFRTEGGVQLESDFNKADDIIYQAREKLMDAYCNITTGRAMLRFMRFFYERPTVRLIIRWRHSAWANHVRLKTNQLSDAQLLRANLRRSKTIIMFGCLLRALGLSGLFHPR